MSEELSTIQRLLKGANLIGIANSLAKTLPPLAVLNDDLYQYTDHHWQLLSDMEIGQYVYTLFAENYPKGWTPQKAKNIIEAIKHNPLIEKVERFDEYQNRNLMNLNNGVLDLDAISSPLLPHDKKYLFTSVIPVDYSPTITECPNFQSFLQDTFRNPNGSVDNDMCDTIITLGGYLIYPKIRAKKLFVFYGNGSNGKSILMDHVFSLFFNPNNVTSLSLNVLSDENSPARGGLKTSKINMCGEQKGGEIASDEIKKIISGETISIRKFYKDLRANFNPTAKHLVSGNDRIYLKDSSYGADRRLFPIDFPNKFVSKQKYDQLEEEYSKIEKTPTEKRVFLAEDERVLAKQLKKEAPAILNLFLSGLQSLRENQWKFKKHASIQAAEEAYKQESDPAMMWIKHSYREGENFIAFQEIYDDYIFWYNMTFVQRKIAPLSKIYLSKKIRECFRVDVEQYKNQKGFNLIKII